MSRLTWDRISASLAAIRDLAGDKPRQWMRIDIVSHHRETTGGLRTTARSELLDRTITTSAATFLATRLCTRDRLLEVERSLRANASSTQMGSVNTRSTGPRSSVPRTLLRIQIRRRRCCVRRYPQSCPHGVRVSRRFSLRLSGRTRLVHRRQLPCSSRACRDILCANSTSRTAC